MWVTLITIISICSVILAYVKGKKHIAKKILKAIDEAQYNGETEPKDLESLVNILIKHIK